MFTTESNEPIGHDQTWLKDGGSGQTGRAIAKGPSGKAGAFKEWREV